MTLDSFEKFSGIYIVPDPKIRKMEKQKLAFDCCFKDQDGSELFEKSQVHYLMVPMNLNTDDKLDLLMLFGRSYAVGNEDREEQIVFKSLYSK
jgi:hypothetical protein